MNGIVFNIEELTFHDGQGIRVTIFLKGCPLDCKWCHNPEGKKANPELLYFENKCCHCGLCNIPCQHDDCRKFSKCIHVCPNNALKVCGKIYTADELANKINQYEDIFSKTNGGITFSGGEPLMQWPFIKEVISKLNNINVTIETSGYCSEEIFKDMINIVNYIYMDIKLVDETKHIKYTGVSNKSILNNFKILKQSNTPFTIRTPLIEGICDTKENLEQIQNLIGDSLWEKLPENTMARAKDKLLVKNYEN